MRLAAETAEAVPPADFALILRFAAKHNVAAYVVRKVVVAGDLFEAGVNANLAADFASWMAAAGVEVAVVPGNHDRGLANGSHGLAIHPDGFLVGRWRVVHGDGPTPDGPVIQGHEHPWARWSDRVEGACYLVGEERIVLPAFSGDAAGANVIQTRKWPKYRCCVIAGNQVLDFGELQTLRKRLDRGPKRPRSMKRD